MQDFNVSGTTLHGILGTNESLTVPMSIAHIAKLSIINCKQIYFEKNSELLSIENHAFNVSHITYISFENCLKLQEIPYFCFYRCYYLEKIVLPNKGKLRKIAQGAFSLNYKLKIFTFPSTIEELEDCIEDYGAIFSDDQVLEEVTFPNDIKLTKVGVGVFWRCKALRKLFLPPHVLYENWGIPPT